MFATASQIKDEFISILKKLQIIASQEHKDVRASCFNGSEIITVERFGFRDADLVSLHGIDSKGGEVVRLVNIRNLDVTFRLVQLGVGQEPSKPIGFV